MSTPASISELHQGLRDRKFSIRETVDQYLQTIGSDNAKFGAWLRTRGQATSEADAADQRLATGAAPRSLEGVPVALKDNLMIEGEVTTAGSKILEHYQAVYTATAVSRLQAAGAIVLGKTNLDEFAMGASTENSALGKTRNPWNPALVPGGSSGGSTAAVAAGQSFVALGSDTGGSIRQPASFCGVVGMKPTYGRVSRYGLMALASSLDQIGPISRNVEDAARVYEVIAGADPADMTTRPEAVPDVLASLRAGIQDLRIGLPKEFFGPGVDPAVVSVIDEARKVFEKLGATVTEVSIPHAPQGLATYYILQPAEASSNLARYDGIRYGLSRRERGTLEGIYRDTRAHGFGAETKRRIMIGTFVLSSGYADAYYHHAHRVREVITEEFHQAFDQVDILLTPTAPTPPFSLGAKTQDPLMMYLADLLTVPASLAGIPALSQPAGLVDGRPVGLQLMAGSGEEVTLFRAAQAFEQATDWHTRRPPGVA